jgi:hypothetical protein
MVDLGGWFKDEFWVGAGTDNRINTKLITKQLEIYLPSDPADWVSTLRGEAHRRSRTVSVRVSLRVPISAIVRAEERRP